MVDEVAGQWIALIAVRPDWPHAVLALVLFRLFDIWKPWPIRRLERCRRGRASCWTMWRRELLALDLRPASQQGGSKFALGGAPG